MWNRPRAPPTLAQGRHTTRLPRIQQDGKSDQGDRNTEQDWELFEPHDSVELQERAHR